MQCVTLPRITELNPHLLCVLCGGYYIDATSIIECLHAFCKSCIVRYLETHKYCPICDVLVHKTEPLQNIRPDVIRQSIVYKLVPNLYKKEMRNRRNFYVQLNPQQHPTCSELKGEITESSNFFSMDDLINLSLEYVNSINEKNLFFVAKGSKRYFRCRAAVTIRSLRKLLAAKYALGVEHKIHLFLDGIQLPDHFKLLDIAYISSWKRVGYIRILYEILTADQSVSSAEKIDLSEIESLKDGNKKEHVEKTVAIVPAVEENTEKFEDLSSTSKTETIDIEISKDSRQSPIITVDLLSPTLEVSNVNISSQPSNDVIIINSSPETSPLAKSSPKLIPVTVDEVLPPAAEKDISVASVDQTDVQLSDKTKSPPSEESNSNNKEETKATKEPSVNEPSDKTTGETDTSTAANSSEKTNSLPPPPSTAPVAPQEQVTKNAPVKSPVTKDTPKISTKKERRSERSESLPPVPALRMINAMPKTSNTKSLTTTVASGLVQPIVSIPRIQSSPRMSSKSTGSYPVASISSPLSLIPPPIPVATDLISLYAKSPVVRQAAPKKPPPSGLSILRIDPKTLSPIEATGSPSTTAIVPVSSNSRKMLPCRPITSSAFSSVYSCAGAPALHPFSKFSSPPPLYPTFPPSSLDPMNELMRRMFPFSFASIDALKPPLDPSARGLAPYPQSISSAMSHFLTTKPASSPAKQAKFEKSRRKPIVSPHVALSLNGGDKAMPKGGVADANRGHRRTNAAVTNGQIKSAVKRKNSELSDFSINNLIPVDEVKRPPPVMHACSADGVNQVCDQMQPISAVPKSESRKSS